MRATEMASFRGDDHVWLVEASLACRVCLSGEQALRLALAARR